MSSAFLGSSAINKSGKKFAPKAVGRRRPGAQAGSEAASQTSSAEQTPAGTPAPTAAPPTEPAASDTQPVLPTPPSTQAPPQTSLVATAADIRATSSESQPPDTAETTSEPIASVPAEPSQRAAVVSHKQVPDTGERSPKRRRIESPAPDRTVATTAGQTGNLSRPTQDAPPVVITTPLEQSSAQAGHKDSAGSSQEVVDGTPNNTADVVVASATAAFEAEKGTQLATVGNIGQDGAEGVPAARIARWKKTPQPKAGRRRGTARLSNQDLIREVMSENAGITKPSIPAPVAEQSQHEDEMRLEGHKESPEGHSEAGARADDVAQPPQDAQGPNQVTKRTPNVTAGKGRRQASIAQKHAGQAAHEQQGEIQPSGTESASTLGNAQEANGSKPTGPTKKPRQPRVSKKRAGGEEQSTDASTNGEIQAPGASKPRRTRKAPITPARVTDCDEERVADGGSIENADGDEGQPARKRHRSLSEHLIFDKEDRENPHKTRINTGSMPMGVLTKDMPMVGAISHREEALSKIDWDEEKRKRMEERERIALGEEMAQTQAERDAALARIQEAANAASTVVQAPQMRIVNGRMTLDTTSTQVDRHARALEDAEELQEVEEDELTTRVNSMSWIKANRKDPRERTTWGPTRADRWSDEQTEQFYEALKMFGTDFFIISKMFPGKTRANVKRKFVKEERLDPERIKRVLIGETVPMDFEEYKRKTGKDDEFFRDPEQLRRELEEESEQRKQEIEEAQARHAEQMRQRKLARGGGDGEGEEGEGGKKKKKKGEGKKGKKTKGPIGGEELEVVEFDGDELTHRR